jgi:hypothetical protein
LQQMYGVRTSVHYAKGWQVRVLAGRDDNINTFWKTISPFVISCMRYKLPKEHRDSVLLKYSSGSEVINDYDVIVDKICCVENTKKNFQYGRVGFDVETETHNYVACGIVVHNCSTTAYKWQGHFGICSRNWELKPSDTNLLWQIAKRYGLEERLLDGVSIQWETVGPGIQNNPLGLEVPDMRCFNVYDITSKKYLDGRDALKFCSDRGLPFVESVSTPSFFNLTDDALRTLAEKQVYPNGKPAEGIVIRPMVEETVMVEDEPCRLSFKVINLLYRD